MVSFEFNIYVNVMSKVVINLCSWSLILAACSSEPLNNSEDIQAAETSQSSAPEKPSCAQFDIQVINAPWAKHPALQQDHQLQVMDEAGEATFHTLGIDRSPDFFFHVLPESFNEFALIKGASRMFAYDCQCGVLQELGIALDDSFEGVDAQSGLIQSVSMPDKEKLRIEITDHRPMEFTLTPDRHFTR